ncbi:hypothetical protein DV738_g4874, partial [Chaetothyriales sp. CBS 135597]
MPFPLYHPFVEAYLRGAELGPAYGPPLSDLAHQCSGVFTSETGHRYNDNIKRTIRARVVRGKLVLHRTFKKSVFPFDLELSQLKFIGCQHSHNGLFSIIKEACLGGRDLDQEDLWVRAMFGLLENFNYRELEPARNLAQLYFEGGQSKDDSSSGLEHIIGHNVRQNWLHPSGPDTRIHILSRRDFGSAVFASPNVLYVFTFEAEEEDELLELEDSNGEEGELEE